MATSDTKIRRIKIRNEDGTLQDSEKLFGVYSKNIDFSNLGTSADKDSLDQAIGNLTTTSSGVPIPLQEQIDNLTNLVETLSESLGIYNSSELIFQQDI